MATIPGVGQTPTLPLETPQTTVDEQQETQSTQQGTQQVTTAPTSAFYEAFVLPRLSLSSLGLGLPQNFGDTAALLSAVSQVLEQTVDETRKNDAVARGEKVRSGLNQAESVFASMIGLSQDITRYADERVQKETLKAQKETELAGLDAQKASLESQRSGLISQRSGLESQRSSLQGTSASLQNQINTANAQIAQINAALATATDPPIIAALNAQKNALQAHVQSLVSQKASVDGQINTLNSQINSLNSQINSLTSQINGIEAQRQTLTNEIATLTTEIAQLADLEAQALTSYFLAQVFIFLFMANFILAPLLGLNVGQMFNADRDRFIEGEFEDILGDLSLFDLSESQAQEFRELVNSQIIEPDMLDKLVKTAIAFLLAFLEALTALTGLPDIAPVDLDRVARQNRTSRLQFAV